MTAKPLFYKLPAEVARRRDLPSAAKVIAAVLIYRLGENESCWPGLRILAGDTGLSVGAVRQSIRHLENGKIFAVQRVKGRANRYRLLIETVSESDTVRKDKCVKKWRTGVSESGTELYQKIAPNQNIEQLNQIQSLCPKSDAFRLAELLLSLILARKPDFKKPNLQGWAKDIDRMIRLDKRTPEQIEAVIRWCQQDLFWQSNILSAAKLREKFDQLELRMKGSNGQQKPKYDRDFAGQRSSIGSDVEM